MKVEDRRFITFTRKELEAALIAAAGLPADTTINSFTVESACLAPPQPVVSMSVTIWPERGGNHRRADAADWPRQLHPRFAARGQVLPEDVRPLWPRSLPVLRQGREPKMTLSTTMKPDHFRVSGGDVMCGRVWLRDHQADQLLAIFGQAADEAFEAGDQDAWRGARGLHSKLFLTIQEARHQVRTEARRVAAAIEDELLKWVAG